MGHNFGIPAILTDDICLGLRYLRNARIAVPRTLKKLYYLVSNGFVVRTYMSSVPTHDRFTLIYQTQFTAAAYANGQLRRYLRSTNRLVSTLQRCIGARPYVRKLGSVATELKQSSRS